MMSNEYPFTYGRSMHLSEAALAAENPESFRSKIKASHPRIHPKLMKILHVCLEADPNRRYNMGEVQTEYLRLDESERKVQI